MTLAKSLLLGLARKNQANVEMALRVTIKLLHNTTFDL